MIGLGLAGLVAFWWLDDAGRGEASVVSAAAVARPAAAFASATVPQRDVAIVERVVPPLDAFAAMVERPLFMPNRQPYVSGDDFSEMQTSAWQPAPASGPPAPTFRFIGSVEENGALRAFVGDEIGVRGLSIGEEVDGWEVLDIEVRRLVIGAEGERLEFTILE